MQTQFAVWQFSRIVSAFRIAPPLPLEKVPVNPHRLDAARIFRFWAVYRIADRINLHRLIASGVWYVELNAKSPMVRGVHPIVIAFTKWNRFPHDKIL